MVETRAKGGNLLLNVGPKPDGELPIEQEERLREVALWMQVNQECDLQRPPLGHYQRTEHLVHQGEERRHRLRHRQTERRAGCAPSGGTSSSKSVKATPQSHGDRPRTERPRSRIPA
ncbi:MAG: alpha-L-fucosidase [Paludibaculum sp.]